MSFLKSTISWLMLAAGWDGGDMPGELPPLADQSAPPLTIVSAVSRMVHGTAPPTVGDVDLLAPNNIEPRGDGPTQLVVGFDGDALDALGGEVTCANVIMVNGTCVSVAGGGTPQLSIHMQNRVKNACIEVDLINIEGLPDHSGPDFTVRVIPADVTRDGVVNLIDLHVVKKHLFEGGSGPFPEFLADQNVDGIVNIVDLANIRELNLYGYLWECP